MWLWPGGLPHRSPNTSCLSERARWDDFSGVPQLALLRTEEARFSHWHRHWKHDSSKTGWWWSRSWELMSDPQANAERERDWGMARLLKFQSTTPVTHHLSEGHTSGSYPNSSANWGSSIKIYKPLGDWECSYSKPYQGPHSHCFSLFSVKAKDFLSLKTVS